jgi:hypothetical protein
VLPPATLCTTAHLQGSRFVESFMRLNVVAWLESTECQGKNSKKDSIGRPGTLGHSSNSQVAPLLATR